MPQYNKRTNRRGLATLELVLFMPFYALFVTALFVVASISLNANQAEMKNRAAAWRFRSEPWLAPQTETLNVGFSQDDATIMGGRYRLKPNLMVFEERVQTGIKSGIGIKGPEARAEHGFVTGVWDYRELPFPKQSDHPRLTVMNKIQYFFRSFNRNAFRRLGGQ